MIEIEITEEELAEINKEIEAEDALPPEPTEPKYWYYEVEWRNPGSVTVGVYETRELAEARRESSMKDGLKPTLPYVTSHTISELWVYLDGIAGHRISMIRIHKEDGSCVDVHRVRIET